MNNKDKFITGQLFIDTGIKDDGIPFDVYLGEHMTIFHRRGLVWINIPYNQRSNYNDNFKETTTCTHTNKTSKLRDFFWDKNNELIWLSNATLSKGEDKLSIMLTQSKKGQPEVGLSNGNKQAYDDGRYINKDVTFSITPSTKPSKIAKTLQAQLGADFVKKEQITYIEQKERETQEANKHIASIERKERETQEANKENQQLQNTNEQTTLGNKKEGKEIEPNEIAKQLQAQLGTNFVKTDHITSIEQKELGNPNEQTKLENQQKEIFCSPTIWCEK